MTIDSILEGITVGVSAGLILGLLSWLYSVIRAKLQRREQIRHLTRTIEQTRDLIYSTSDLDFTKHSVGRIVPKEEVRKAQFQWLYRQIQQILLGRASRLKFDEIQQVKNVFTTFELYPEWIPNDNAYDGIFSQFESIDWLRLSPRR